MLLKPQVLAQVLSSATSNGVESALLFNADGSLISLYIAELPTLGCLQSKDTAKAVKIHGAVAASVWKMYEKHSQTLGQSDQDSQRPDSSGDLETLAIDCELGKLAIIKTGGGRFIALVARTDTPWNILFSRLDGLNSHISPSLQGLA